MSFIPAGSVINSATLYLYANNNAPNGIVGQPTYGNDNAGYLRRITQSWNENTVTWNNQPATTTVNQVLIPQSTSTSQDGFMISEINEVNYYNSLIFCSSDIPDTSLAPALVVTYTAPGGMICFEVQPNAADGKDASVTTQVPTANYGTLIDYEGITWTCQSVLCNGRSLIQFDLSAIPSTANIDSAFLFLYANNNAVNGIVGQPTYGTDNAGYLRRITQTWDENTVTWNNQPATTTQDEVIIPQSTSSSQDYTLDIKAIVQASVQNPSTSFGFMISEINEVNYYNSLIFGSSDAADANIHPKLKVCYTPTTAISENNFSTLSIYPNPSGHSFVISDSGHSIDQVEVYNMLGEMIIIQKGRGNSIPISIDGSSLTIGVYFARIITDHGTIVRKLVKN
ncbi:MAG: DNRLRE domain-containing protein [Bacteroidetes bacterium]|nr:DNRLRE domain-containing protein [Bacteroidota bacterium]